VCPKKAASSSWNLELANPVAPLILGNVFWLAHPGDADGFERKGVAGERLGKNMRSKGRK
jgi:hypothetical protein